MAQKRPYDDEVVNEVASKHPRQDRPNDELISCNGSFSMEGSSEKPYDSGEVGIAMGDEGYREQFENGSCSEISREAVKDIEADVPRSASLSYWATSSSSDEDEPPEEGVHTSFFPGYFGFDRTVRSAINPDDVYYCLLDYPPRKRVPVGPDHQAEIPVLIAQENDNTLDASGKSDPATLYGDALENDDRKLDGICVLPCPVSEPPPHNGEKVGDGRRDCSCPDQGSIRCVRQHITEARDKLKRTLGQDTFSDLGFYDMGEVVAEKWSAEEEQLFHEVVYSNPASMGKNFWNALWAVFPSRTKMEIVSYYFNVFMLRKRAEQNRCYPTNIDSDDDEWKGSDFNGGDEDDDSGVESPARHDNLEFHQNGFHGHDDDDDDDDHDEGDVSDEAQKADENGERFAWKSEVPSKKSDDDDGGENDAQDGSCTSSDSGAPVGTGAQLKADGCHEWNEYILDSAKAWDGYNNMSCPKSNVEFLPTCSMIEEVFGDGEFDFKSKRW